MAFQIRSTKEDLNAFNNPKLIKMSEFGVLETPFILPFDTVIAINGTKVIAESKILDGVSVYERILRNPYQIDFTFTLRENKAQTNYNDWTASGTVARDFVFPQKVLENFFTNVWKRNAVISVTNTLLGGLGITQIVIKDFNIDTVQGSTNLPCRLSCAENFVPVNALGETLIKG